MSLRIGLTGAILTGAVTGRTMLCAMAVDTVFTVLFLSFLEFLSPGLSLHLPVTKTSEVAMPLPRPSDFEKNPLALFYTLHF